MDGVSMEIVCPYLDLKCDYLEGSPANDLAQQYRDLVDLKILEEQNILIDHYKNALEQVKDEPYVSYLNENKEQLAVLEQMVTAIRCYCREANLTYLMRKHVEGGSPIPEDLIRRFNAIMQVDVMNQEKGYAKNTYGNPTAAEMLESFQADPSRWVITNFVYR